MKKPQGLTRKEIVSLLYKSAFEFFRKVPDFGGSITFKEVHLNESLRVDIFNLYRIGNGMNNFRISFSTDRFLIH